MVDVKATNNVAVIQASQLLEKYAAKASAEASEISPEGYRHLKALLAHVTDAETMVEARSSHGLR